MLYFYYLDAIMRFLRKIVLAVCLIILLALLKILFARTLPQSLIFHYNAISSLQLLLLLWAVITGLLESTIWKGLPTSAARRKGFFSFLGIALLTETICLLLLHHPKAIPRPFINSFRYYYDNYDRDILQYNTIISRYDPKLFYRMIGNNRSLFSNIEFSDSIVTDSNGMRNDNQTARKAKILCLGDSYTLGWGLQQNESYPAQLQDILQKPVLNTGMSSYGTIREVTSVSPLEKSGVSTIIIQYCYNDAGENQAYTNDHFHLNVSPKTTYDSAVNVLKWSNLYFPGKCFCTLTKYLLREQLGALLKRTTAASRNQANDQAAEAAGYQSEARWFIDILKHSGWDLRRIHVFVFDICDYQELTGKFISALGQELTKPENIQLKDHVHPLHIEQLLTPEDYYILDEHIRPSGAAKLARFVAGAINAAQP